MSDTKRADSRTVRLGDIVLVAEHIRGFQVITHTARLPYSVPRHRVIAHVAGYGPITVDDCATKEAAAERLDMLERELEGLLTVERHRREGER